MSQEFLTESPEIQIQCLEAIVQPYVALTGKKIRIRSAPTKIKSLVHLYQLHKNIISGKWTENFQGKKKICEKAQVGKKHFSEFINSPDFELFGKVKHRYGTTNIYELHPWLIEAFQFFEAMGMMQGFRTNFDAWKEKFLKRIHRFVIPQLQKGYTLKELLMNRISTKSNLKGVGSPTLKGVGIKPPGSSMNPAGSGTNNVSLRIQGIERLERAAQEMRDRFHLKEGDINWVINSLGLRETEGGLRIRRGWGDFKPQSPIATFMACVNIYKKQRKHG